MAMPNLRRRLLMLGLVSFTTLALLGLWLGGNRLPSLPIFKGWRPTVTLRQGTIVGFEAKTGYPHATEQFLGIPYALSPTGARRFGPPIPVKASKGNFDASKYGCRCPAGTPGGIAQDEDCLNLNVYRRKRRSKNKKLPVVIHFHGGSFNFGFGSGTSCFTFIFQKFQEPSSWNMI